MKGQSMNPFSRHPKTIEQALHQSIRYLNYQPRTCHQIKLFIRKKGFDEDTVEKVIEILIEKKYLDDTAFAKMFVESSIRSKPKSKFALGYELNKRKIDPSIIESVLSDLDDTDLALKAVALKTRTWVNFDTQTKQKKIMNFLRYRGFGYDISMATLDRFMTEED